MYRRPSPTVPARHRRRLLIGQAVAVALIATTALVPAASATPRPTANTPGLAVTGTPVLPLGTGDDPRPYAITTVGSHRWDSSRVTEERNFKYHSPTMSDDGRFVTSNEIVVEGGKRMAWLYLVDTETGTKELVNRSVRNPERGPDYEFTLYTPNYRVSRGLVSGDGKTVVFEAPAQQLPPAPDRFLHRGTWPYVYDAQTKVVTALPDPGLEIDPWSGWYLHPEDISTDGRTVLLSHQDRHLYLADLAADPPSTRKLFPEAGKLFNEAQISGDGRFLLAVEAESSLQWTRLYDLSTPEPTQVWETSGVNAHRDFRRFSTVAIDEDGSTIAWVHNQSVPSSTRLYVLDRTTGEQTTVPHEVTTPAPGWGPGGLHTGLSMSADGSTLAFTLERRKGSDNDVFTHDLASGRTTLVSWPATGGPLDEASPGVFAWDKVAPDLSADGRTVSFSTRDSRLVPDRTSDLHIARAVDLAVPEWPAGAQVRTTDVGASFVALEWDAAHDDTGVTGYRVLVDGVEVGRTDAATRTFVVEGLDEATGYRIGVVPVDASDGEGPALEVDVTTAGLAPGAAALTARANANGTVTLSWDRAGTGDTYRVSRTVDGVTTTATETTALNHVDVGVPAQTTVTYRVDRVVGDGIASHTVERSVTTPALGVPALEWDVARLRGGVLELGADLTITATGQPGRTTSATLDTDGDVPSIEVELTETTAGTYEGTVVVPEGITAIRRMTVTLDDGAGHQASALGRSLPAPVSGAVHLDITTGADLDGFVIEISNSAARTASRVEPTGTGSVTLPVHAGTAHVLRVWRPDGSLSTTVPLIDVDAGRTTVLTLTIKHLSTLLVTVVDPDGVPLRDISVDVRADGSTNATRATTGTDGVAKASTGWTDGLTAYVTTTSRLRPMVTQAATTVELAPGLNAITIEAEPVPETSVTGTVLDGAGDPAANAEVTVSQVVDGQAYTRRVRTGSDGRFTATGFAGDDVTVAARTPINEVGSVTVTLGGGTPDVTITTRQYLADTVDLDVRFKGPGDDEFGPSIGIDWSTAIHLNVRLKVLSGSVNGNAWYDSRTKVNGTVGSTFQVCVDGREAGLGAGCSAPLTLKADGSVLPAEIRIADPAGIRATLVDAAGLPLTGPWAARISGPSGTHRITGSTPELVTTLASPGTHTVQVNRTEGSGSGSASVEVVEGGATDAGAIVVGATGAFLGAGNVLASTRDVLLPGETGELRVELSASRAVAGATLHVEAPVGWSVLGGTTLDGEPVARRGDAGEQLVDLGSLARGDTGVVRVPVQVPEDATPQDTDARAVVVDADGATHLVGTTEVAVVGLTLEVPQTVHERTVTASGRAPVGTEVTVLDGAQPVGLAVAGPAGRWTARIDLSERPVFHEYTLTAAATVGGMQVRSEPAHVTYDPTAPVMEEIVVQQDGRTVRVSPGDGVARFPFVIVNADFRVSVRYADHRSVAAVNVTVGRNTLPAVRGADGVFTATFPLRFGQEGPIWIETVAGDPSTLGWDDPRWNLPDPTDTEATGDLIRTLLPGDVQDLTIDETTTVEVPATGTEPRATGSTIVATAPSLAGGGGTAPQVTATLTVSEPTEVTPSAEDAKLSNAAGVPVFGISRSGDAMSGGVSFYLQLEDSAPPTAGFGASAPAWLGAVRQIAQKITLEWSWNAATKAHDLNSALTSGTKYDKINRLLTRAEKLPPECIPHDLFRRVLGDLANFALAIDAASAASMAISMVAAPATLGLSLGLFVVTLALDKMLAYMWDEEHDRLSAALTELEQDCKRKPPPPPQPPVDPDYIYDPSGFVYEGLESNRLADVTATVLYAPTADGPWEVWDAEWYGQENPQLTDADGRYAWDVPRGFWQVRYEKEGYVTAFSDVLEVLPPHTDVNISMMPTTAPEVKSVSAADGVDLTFTQLIDAGWVGPGTVEVAREGEPVEGTIVPVTSGATSGTLPDGRTVATAFRFAPEDPLRDGDELQVTVHPEVRNHAERPMAALATRTVVVETPDDTEGPGGPGGPEEPGGPDGPGEPGGPGDGDGSGEPGTPTDPGGAPGVIPGVIPPTTGGGSSGSGTSPGSTGTTDDADDASADEQTDPVDTGGTHDPPGTDDPGSSDEEPPVVVGDGGSDATPVGTSGALIFGLLALVLLLVAAAVALVLRRARSTTG